MLSYKHISNQGVSNRVSSHGQPSIFQRVPEVQHPLRPTGAGQRRRHQSATRVNGLQTRGQEDQTLQLERICGENTI